MSQTALKREDCTPMEETNHGHLYQDQFLQSIFDAIPAFVFIVDEDVRLHFWNAPARALVGEDSTQVYMKRGGEVLHCIQAIEAKHGCGTATFCDECVIRNSVGKAMTDGKTSRDFARVERRVGDSTSEVYLLVTSSPFHYKEQDYAMLLIEDVSRLLDEPREKEKQDQAKEEPAVTLSASELDILKWLKQGKSSWSISRILEMNMRTVNYHIYNIIAKLDAMNRTHAVAIALEMGLIQRDD